MPKLVDIQDIGLIEVPDDVGENELQELVDTFDQGRISSAGSALMREGGRMVGGAMMGLARAASEEPPPTITAAQAESPAGMAAYERRLLEWEKRTKAVSPEELQRKRFRSIRCGKKITLPSWRAALDLFQSPLSRSLASWLMV
jgi:hypothetical protein